MLVAILAALAGLQGAEGKPEIPFLEGGWRRIAAPPKLERFGTGKEQTVDFTIFRAADGTWQLVSCIRNTAHPGDGRLLYRWEGKSLEDADWEPRGIFLTSDAKLGHREGRAQAPHCVLEEGTYWLFYSSTGAHALTSKDGKAFEPARAADGAFRFFDMPRDLALFDHRARDGKWYAFFTDIRPGKYPERKDHTVSYRTAPRLAGPWSAEKTDVGVVSPSPPGYLFAMAESPFVLERGGWLYRLEQLNVLASRDLSRWEGPPVASLAGPNVFEYLAPELVVDGDRTWLAAYRDHGKAGIFLARLGWKRAP